MGRRPRLGTLPVLVAGAAGGGIVDLLIALLFGRLGFDTCCRPGSGVVTAHPEIVVIR